MTYSKSLSWNWRPGFQRFTQYRQSPPTSSAYFACWGWSGSYHGRQSGVPNPRRRPPPSLVIIASARFDIPSTCCRGIKCFSEFHFKHLKMPTQLLVRNFSILLFYLPQFLVYSDLCYDAPSTSFSSVTTQFFTTPHISRQASAP